MRSMVIAAVGVAALGRLATATPWTDRCQRRLAAVTPTLASIGKATITITPPPPQPAPGPYVLKVTDPIGEITLAIATSDRTYTATIGTDHSQHRYRGRRGMESIIYERWHSPYLDTTNGDIPELAVQPMLEEFHHHLAVGVIRAQLRVDASGAVKRPVRPVRSTPTDSPHAPPDKGTPTYTGTLALFASTLRPVLEACWTDVLPDEADTSLAWTKQCLADLAKAHAALVNVDPTFANGTCAREPYNVSCGNVSGNEPRWNALTSLAGGANPKLVWSRTGTNRRSYADGGALIWASDTMPAAKFDLLVAAFDKPLERCSQLLRANMYP